jgi:hypothetical protein
MKKKHAPFESPEDSKFNGWIETQSSKEETWTFGSLGDSNPTFALDPV